MHILDEKIMKALLAPYDSMYKLHADLKKNGLEQPYTTVLRHIKNLQKAGLIKTEKATRKNGQEDKRETEKLELTLKGVATIIAETNLERNEIQLAGMKILQKWYGNLPERFMTLAELSIDDVLSKTFERMKPQLNLKFFDENYFNRILCLSLADSLVEMLKNIKLPKDREAQVQARKFKKKYVRTEQVEFLKEMLASLKAERHRFDILIQGFTRYLKAME